MCGALGIGRDRGHRSGNLSRCAMRIGGGRVVSGLSGGSATSLCRRDWLLSCRVLCTVPFGLAGGRRMGGSVPLALVGTASCG